MKTESYRWSVLLLLTLAALLIFKGQSIAMEFNEAGISAFETFDLDLSGRNLEGTGIQFLLAGQWFRRGSLRLDLILEMSGTIYRDYASGMELCLVPGVRVYFPERLDTGPSPYMEAGLGLSYTDLEIKEIGMRTNFRTFGGLGVRFPIYHRSYIDVGCRVTHISNGGFENDNHGVTAIMPIVGWVVTF
jgi:hypothetical protein